MIGESVDLTTLAKALRDAGEAQEALAFLRRAARTAYPLEASPLWDSFPDTEWDDIPAATATLLYGPGYESQPARPWTWADLCPPEP